jgi:5,10-methenyltetrahydrofolate synthetase
VVSRAAPGEAANRAAAMRYHSPMPHSAPRSAADAPQGAALHEAKLALRREVLALRNALAPDARAAASAAIARRVAALPEFAAARTVLLTLAFRSEWNTLLLVHAALAESKTVVVPRVDRQTRMLELHSIADPDRDVVPGHLDIPEPLLARPRVPRDAIDFVLVPGVAFDLEGRRLGYGGGYYDRLLPLLSPRAARVAGAFEIQIVERVPAAPHDVRVDAIVTESRIVERTR